MHPVPAVDVFALVPSPLFWANTMTFSTRSWAVVAAVSCTFLSSCTDSGDFGTVTGKVTLDGQPLANAQVDFTPVSGGRPSTAVTDDDGDYELKYTMKQDGAESGEHTVSVSTYEISDGEVTRPELVPEKYNLKTTLTKTVESGSNDIPIELNSDGPIAKSRQPRK